METQDQNPIGRKKPGPKPKKRAPMGDANTSTRKSLSRKKRMDVSHYQEKYGNTHKLLLVLDSGGDLDSWLDVGAEVVKREVPKGASEFDTFRGRSENPYVRFVGGQINGETVYQYLLIIPLDVYDEVKTAPNRARQAEIRDAMGLNGGEGMAMEARAVNTAGVETYAPHNVLGSKGFKQSQ